MMGSASSSRNGPMFVTSVQQLNASTGHASRRLPTFSADTGARGRILGGRSGRWRERLR